MEDDSEAEKLAFAVRQLSSSIDAAALELSEVLGLDHITELQDISVLLCDAADAIENPSYRAFDPEVLSPGHRGEH